MRGDTARKICCALAVSLALASTSSAQRPKAIGPNLVEITPRLITSGQPSAEALAGLGAQGFEAVIYLLNWP